jgi:proteic killer suppression protein
MIVSFRSKALEELFTKGKSKKLPQERIKKIKMILDAMNAAVNVKDLDFPAFRLHQLKAPPYRGFWSIDVTGNYRIVFRFEEGDISEVEYLDTH